MIRKKFTKKRSNPFFVSWWKNKNFNFWWAWKRSQRLYEEEKEISTTTSEWVKARNIGFLALIDSANNKILDEIEKSIKK